MSAFVIAAALVLGAGDPPPSATPTPTPLPAVSTDRWLAEDKLRHFTMSFAVTQMAYGAARVALDPDPAAASAVGLAAILGVGKELVDRRAGGPFSARDLVWDAAGIALGLVLVLEIR
jgi:uncharacterized protein YfiM (DUF2279 family)